MYVCTPKMQISAFALTWQGAQCSAAFLPIIFKQSVPDSITHNESLEKENTHFLNITLALRFFGLPRIISHLFQALNHTDYHPTWSVLWFSAPAILFGLTSSENSDKVLSLTTQTILPSFSAPDMWRIP